MKIETLNGRAKYVKRYRKGRCYAAVFSSDLNDKQIEGQVKQGVAAFFPFNETTGRFVWGRGSGKPLFFKR